MLTIDTDLKLLDVAELASAMGVSMQQIRNYQAQGMVGTKIRGKWQFNHAHCETWRTANVQNKYCNKKDADEESARFRKIAAEASIMELKLKRLSGELISAEAAIELVKNEYAKARTKLLSVASSVAPHCYINDLAKRQKLINDAIRSALAELMLDTMSPAELAEETTRGEWVNESDE